jgi:hypothetical protein
MLDTLIITSEEIGRELASLAGRPDFATFANEQRFHEHGQSAKSEYSSYMVCCYALFRVGAFVVHPHRHPGVSAAYWLHRYAFAASGTRPFPPDTDEWVGAEELAILGHGVTLENVIEARRAAEES